MSRGEWKATRYSKRHRKVLSPCSKWEICFVNSDFFSFPADTCSKAISVCRSTTTSKKQPALGHRFNTYAIWYSLEKKLFLVLRKRSRRTFVDVSAGSAVHPAEPWRPFTSWALRGHAMLHEWGQPFGLYDSPRCGCGGQSSSLTGVVPKKPRSEGGGEQGKGRGCPVLLVGHRYGSGSSKSLTMFYCGSVRWTEGRVQCCWGRW